MKYYAKDIAQIVMAIVVGSIGMFKGMVIVDDENKDVFNGNNRVQADDG